VEQGVTGPTTTYTDYGLTDEYNQVFKAVIKKEQRAQGIHPSVPFALGNEPSTSENFQTTYSYSFSKKGFGISMLEARVAAHKALTELPPESAVPEPTPAAPAKPLVMKVATKPSAPKPWRPIGGPLRPASYYNARSRSAPNLRSASSQGLSRNAQPVGTY
jgi:hypothetical protein